ncbi:MAG: hypothetical protein IAX21_00245 [Candidatus Bathyarchaeota archaeon]|nr:MAG: hypothetical protein IAX21_00245 [Candidatus Bathyarchaeota archaeon]
MKIIKNKFLFINNVTINKLAINLQRCAVCGKAVDLPFKCKYCGLRYCDEHRLPESHNCVYQLKKSPEPPNQEYNLDVCVECKTKLNDSTTKPVTPCPHCGRNMCSYHLHPTLASIPNLKYQSKEQKAIAEQQKLNHKGKGGHPCFPYTRDFWQKYDKQYEYKMPYQKRSPFPKRHPQSKPYSKPKTAKSSNKKWTIIAIIIVVFLVVGSYYLIQNPNFLADLTDLNKNDTSNTESVLPELPNSDSSNIPPPETVNSDTQSNTNTITHQELEINPKNLSLKYLLYGETNQLSFTVFDGVNEYLSEIPRTISYFFWETEPTKKDFVMKFLNDDVQMDYLIDLVDEIKSETSSKDDQARIAISLVQQIPYDWGGLSSVNSENRYPYEVISDEMGVCEEKSRLLVFLLRELGFDTVLFNFESENHMAVGIKCSFQYCFKDTGYCFVETTNPSIITYDQAEYVGVGKLTSTPEIIHVSDGFSFDSVSEEYNDAQEWIRLNNLASPTGYLSENDYNNWWSLINKYGINVSD